MGWPDCDGIDFLKMAAEQGANPANDDFDVVVAIVDADMFLNDEDFDADIQLAIEELPSEKSPQFSCQFCEKKCLSKGGLTRHVSCKHPDKEMVTNLSTNSANSKKKQPEEILHPLYFKKYVIKSLEKLAVDDCYPQNMMLEFNQLLTDIKNLNDTAPAYEILKPFLISFNGDTEKFYPRMFKAFQGQNLYRGLSSACSDLLSLEVITQVLAHLSGASVEHGSLVFTEKKREFDDKEKAIIGYLSGYVFGTFYRRIRFSKHGNKDIYQQQCLSFLLAGKCSVDSEKVEQKHVSLFDRGGLWRVTKEVFNIFSCTELAFLSHVERYQNKIDCKVIVSGLMRDSWVLVNASKIRESSPDVIKNEIALNLLSELLTLYVRVRAFSHVKDKLQKAKIEKSKTRSRSLRTDMKKQSKSLQDGH